LAGSAGSGSIGFTGGATGSTAGTAGGTAGGAAIGSFTGSIGFTGATGIGGMAGATAGGIGGSAGGATTTGGCGSVIGGLATVGGLGFFFAGATAFTGGVGGTAGIGGGGAITGFCTDSCTGGGTLATGLRPALKSSLAFPVSGEGGATIGPEGFAIGIGCGVPSVAIGVHGLHGEQFTGWQHGVQQFV
jgi:hypothetical protein